MSQTKQLVARLLAVGASLCLPFVANADQATDTPFRIMNAGEVATHTAAMKALEGTAREDYRNTQYAELKARAARSGYRMPDTPPWASAAGAESGETTAAVREPSGGPEAEARHAELREKLKASRTVAEKAAEANLNQFKPAESAEPAGREATVVTPKPVASNQPDAVAAQAPAASGADALPPAATAQAPDAPALPDPPVAAETVAGEPPVIPSAVAPMPAERDYGSFTALPPPTPTAPARVVPDSPPAHAAEPPQFVPPPVAAQVQAIAPSEPAATADAVEAIPLADLATPPAMPATPEAAPTAVLPPPPAPAPRPTPAYGAAPEAGDKGLGAMPGYREQMRTRFDEYIKERQAQIEENARRQREEREATMARNRGARPGFTPIPAPAPAFPAGPPYGPRYPAAYPGYRTPYWQQP